MAKVALAALAASLASIAVFAAVFSAIAFLAIPETSADYVERFANVFAHALAIFLLPAMAICASTGFLLLRQVRRTGRTSAMPFLGWGLLIGVSFVGGLWWVLVGSAWRRVDLLMIPAGALVGLSGGAAYYVIARACGLMSPAAQQGVAAAGR